MDPNDGLKFEIMKGPSNDSAVQKNCALFEERISHVPKTCLVMCPDT